MDYVIDIQGFFDGSHNFIVKEVSVVALDEDHIGHWVATSPCAFAELPTSVRDRNNYLSMRHHGIEWFDGDIPTEEIYAKLRCVARTARTIYTRGVEKAKLLQTVTSRVITNLEDDSRCPAFKDLQPSGTRCLHHGVDTRRDFICSLNRATRLKTWLNTRNPVRSSRVPDPGSDTTDTWNTSDTWNNEDEQSGDSSDPSGLCGWCRQ